MTEFATGQPLNEAEIEAIGAALRDLPDGLGGRVVAGLACAASLGFNITTFQEGDTPIPGHRFKQDTGEAKERYRVSAVVNRNELWGKNVIEDEPFLGLRTAFAKIRATRQLKSSLKK